MLYLHHRESCTQVLGPGLRYALWVQGCRKRCPGCINPEGWPLDEGGYWMSVERVMEELGQMPQLDGITISGGEPFLQAAALHRLVARIKAETRLDIMVYSGYTLPELRNRHDEEIDGLLDSIDLLIDGEYREEENTNKIYRGSDNQNIHFLSSKYLPWRRRMLETENRSLEFVCRDNDELFMVGLPAKGFRRLFMERFCKGMEEHRE